METLCSYVDFMLAVSFTTKAAFYKALDAEAEWFASNALGSRGLGA